MGLILKISYKVLKSKVSTSLSTRSSEFMYMRSEILQYEVNIEIVFERHYYRNSIRDRIIENVLERPYYRDSIIHKSYFFVRYQSDKIKVILSEIVFSV